MAIKTECVVFYLCDRKKMQSMRKRMQAYKRYNTRY